MQESLKTFFVLLKDWWEFSLFATVGLIGLVVKACKTYRLTHSSAYKIAAIEKVLEEKVLYKDECEGVHDRCQEMNELRFQHGAEEFNSIKGRFDKVDQTINDNHNHLVSMILEIQKGHNGKEPDKIQGS